MFQKLNQINSKPKPFEYYTARELWTDEHTSKQMLAHHLDGSVDICSRKFSFIDQSVKWIISYFGLSSTSKIADFGCGPGLYTIRFAERGIQVTGLDFSERSISYAEQQAREKSLTITYINQNYLEARLDETYDLVIMIMCDFCALSPDQRRLLLGKFHNSLKPNGHVLLDVYSFHAFDKKEEGASYSKHQSKGFWSEKPYYEFLNTFRYEKEKVTVDKYTIIREEKMYTIYNWLQYFSRDSISKEFEAAGFHIHDYFADVAGSVFSFDADEFAVVAGKK
jgi:2-polyprenyl-3-methyl-5-hydroxy-6-metoxy-1,4-benzoquinol methylase